MSDVKNWVEDRTGADLDVSLDGGSIPNSVTNLFGGAVGGSNAWGVQLFPNFDNGKDVSQLNKESGDNMLAVLTAEINADKNLDEFTRAELLKDLSKQNMADRRSIFELAKKQEGKFKDRKVAEERLKILRDQPGRKQTFLTGGGNTSNGGEGGTFLTGL